MNFMARKNIKCIIVINVHVNVDHIQSVLPHDEPTIRIFLKMMFSLWYLIETVIQGFECYHSPSMGI